MNTPVCLLRHLSRAAILLLAVHGGVCPTVRAGETMPLKFSFASGPPPAGFVGVVPETVFTKERGYGFEAGAMVAAGGRGVVSDRPFFFSARVPAEGNYRVSVAVGDATAGTSTTIKAELRRLMVEQIATARGEFKTVSFVVNTRTPKIAATGDIKTGEVRLKAPRETTQEAWAWDDLLTIEFNGARPAVSAIEIAPADLPTVFLLGDSTVCDQSREPYNSWGQMLPRFFARTIAVANHGESGETYRDSIGRRRLDKILSVMRPGDWLIMQFGHNDQKQIAAGTGGPFTTYKDEIRRHVEGVRSRGGVPVIVSPMERRGFDEAGKVKASLADYAEAARQAARELGVAFIDLNEMSKRFYEALGPEASKAAFAEPEPGRIDNTHHCNYGSYELAKCVAQGLRDAKLELAKHLAADFIGFDPARPDPVAAFAVPPSPNYTNQRPLGD